MNDNCIYDSQKSEPGMLHFDGHIYTGQSLRVTKPTPFLMPECTSRRSKSGWVIPRVHLT